MPFKCVSVLTITFSVDKNGQVSNIYFSGLFTYKEFYDEIGENQ